MTNEIQNLILAIEEWRGSKTTTGPSAKIKSPYGAKIYEANMKWAATKQAALEAIKADEEKYQAEIGKLNDLHNRWLAEQSQGRIETAKRGPKRHEHSDDVKMAAAAAIRAGYKRTLVRITLGLNDTQRLNELLREGEELLQVQELQERDKKVDQATGEEW